MFFNSKAKRVYGKLLDTIKDSGLFDSLYYLRMNQDARLSDLTPLEHYCEVGIIEYRKPNAEFDPLWYLEEYKDVAESEIDAFTHFIRFGRYENRFQNESEKNEYESLGISESFDPKIYLKLNVDLPQNNQDFDPLFHYVRYGKKEGRLFFHEPELAPASVSSITSAPAPAPTLDIIKTEEPIAQSEDEKLVLDSGLFDKSYYLGSYPDVMAANIDPVQHFCENGWKEGRNPNEEFSVNYYNQKYPDIKKAGMNPFIHWLKYGRNEGRFINKIEVNADLIEKTNTPSIIFISHEASQTGAPAVLLSLMQWLKKYTEINFSIVVGAQGPWNHRFEELAPTFYMDGEHHDLERELRQFCGNHVQAVYINTIASALYAEQLTFLQAEFITHVHEMENVFNIFELHVEVLKRICQKYISVSPGSTKAIEKRFNLNEIELHYLKPFIDKGRLSTHPPQKPTNKKVVFGCGAVELRKGFDFFCEVAQKLKEQGRTDVEMYWIGSDTDKDLVAEEVIAKYNVAEIVHFMGTKSYPREYFAWGDIFLLPSREDPYPLVCMEAAECGMPVICFDENAGGMHTFVEDDAGYVVPHLDTTAMANAVVTLLDNEEKRQELGQQAKRKVKERHYVDVIAPQILAALPAHLELTGTNEIESYKALIKNAKAVSFDIFDTLVTRRVAAPEVVFDVIEYRHTQDGAAPLPLFEQRMQTAGRVLGSYQGQVDDISIDEIYQHMPLYTNSEIEKQTEIQMCVAHPMGKQLYEYALRLKKPIYIASDMYLDTKTVQAILRTNGYNHWDAFFLSSDKGQKKDTGRLFNLVKEQAAKDGIEPAEILHLGDNWIGDVKCAREAGLTAVRFAPLYERTHKLIDLPNPSTLSQTGRIWQSFSTQATRLWCETHPDQANDFYTRLGFELTGPLASMMAMHTRRLADQQQAKKIVFMARDGRIIQKAFNTLYSKEINKGQYQSSYLHLSRATVVPATFNHPLTSNDIYFLMEGLHLGKKPLSYFIEKAGLSITDKSVTDVVKNHFTSIKTVPEWEDFAALAKLLTDLSEPIYAANKPKREALAAYLEQHGLLNTTSENVILVDVGWLLNIQSRLVNFAKAQGAATRFVGAYVGSRDRIHKNMAHQSLLFDKGDPSQWAAFLEQHVTLFEVLFSAPEASATGLQLNAQGAVDLQLKPLEIPIPAEFHVAQKLHFGAELYFERLAEAREVFFPEQVSRDYFFQLFQGLVTTDSDLAKATLGNFEVRLGGHHEFITHQSLIPSSKSFEYTLKSTDEYFEPVSLGIKNNEYAQVLIISSAGLQNGSTRYRGLHLADALSRHDMSATLMHAATPIGIAKQLIERAETIVFQRCFEEQGHVGQYLKLARSANKRCIAEMDDLVFPEFIPSVGSVKGGEWNIDEAMFVATSYEKLIEKMDACIVSTPLLKEHIEERYGIPACVIRNKVMPQFLQAPVKNKNASLKLIYASGTYSHKEDFEIIEDVLYQFLLAQPEVQLSILGAAQVSERLLALPNVANYPLLPYTAMLDFIARHDLMLMPLEDDIFNRAKSSVKFVECGAVGVPVLASKVGEFDYAITHEKEGLLAEDTVAFEKYLNKIVESPDLLENMANNAYKAIAESYTTSILESDALEIIKG